MAWIDPDDYWETVQWQCESCGGLTRQPATHECDDVLDADGVIEDLLDAEFIDGERTMQ